LYLVKVQDIDKQATINKSISSWNEQSKKRHPFCHPSWIVERDVNIFKKGQIKEENLSKVYYRGMHIRYPE